MPTIRPPTLGPILTILALTFAVASQSGAGSSAPASFALPAALPADAVPLPDTPPANVTGLYLLSSLPAPPLPPPVAYSRRTPAVAPVPVAWSGVPTNGPAYFSPSLGAVFVDDRLAAAERMLRQADTPVPPIPGDGDWSPGNDPGGGGTWPQRVY